MLDEVGTADGPLTGTTLAARCGLHADAARARVLALLGDLGFDPQQAAAGDEVRQTSSPLLAAAREHPDVVCAVHPGIVPGALAEHGVSGGAP